MSALLEFASEIRAVCEERDTLAKARSDAAAELASTRRDRDCLRESVNAWQEAERIARGRWHSAEAERDAARSELAGRDKTINRLSAYSSSELEAKYHELAGVAAQRDAYLTRSVELATRVTELEADYADIRERVREACACLRETIGSNGSKNIEEYAERAAARIIDLEAKTFDLARLEQDSAGLRSALASEARKTFDMRARITDLEARLAAAPVETAEVDGFRVGDLVRSVRVSTAGVASVSHWRAITGFSMAQRSDAAASRRALYDVAMPDGVPTHELARKPVEVGDTVRCVSGAFVGRVKTIQRNEIGIAWAWFVGSEDACVRLDDCIAVAP